MKSEVSKMIKRLRMAAELSQEEAAQRAKVGRVYLSYIEIGKSDARDGILTKIICAFGFSIKEAKNMIAECRILDVLKKTPDRNEVLKNVTKIIQKI